jgi:hypothetical protein
MMKRALLSLSVIFLVLSFGFFGQTSGTKVRILPFKIWKQKKIDEAKTVVAELKRQNKKTIQGKAQVKSDNQDDEDKQGSIQQLSQAELNLGVARELSANDYFLLYVSPQFKNNNEALVQAARALSPRDIADILEAYQKRLQTTDISTNTSDAEADIQEKSPQSP